MIVYKRLFKRVYLLTNSSSILIKLEFVIYIFENPISNDGICVHVLREWKPVFLRDLATEPRELCFLICFVLTSCSTRLNATYSSPWDLLLSPSSYNIYIILCFIINQIHSFFIQLTISLIYIIYVWNLFCSILNTLNMFECFVLFNTLSNV